MPSPGSKIIKLKQADQFRLMEWLKANKDFIYTKSASELIPVVASELKLEVTVANVNGARRALGLSRATNIGPGSNVAARLADLEEKVRRIYEDLYPPEGSRARLTRPGEPF